MKLTGPIARSFRVGLFVSSRKHHGSGRANQPGRFSLRSLPDGSQFNSKVFESCIDCTAIDSLLLHG